jgi:hypothetical protein
MDVHKNTNLDFTLGILAQIRAGLGASTAIELLIPA